MEPRETLEPDTAWHTFFRFFVAIGPPYGILMSLVMAVPGFLAGRFDPVRMAITAVGSGLAFGGVLSLAMLPMLREVSFALPIGGDREVFAACLNAALKKVHYLEVDGVGSFWVSRPTWRAGSLSGSIRVGLDETTARLAGPQHALKKVERHLRRGMESPPVKG